MQNGNNGWGCLGLAMFIGIFGAGAILILATWLIVAAVSGIVSLF